ncbi:MAG: polysaccharide biosynthesis tyrosine autokinase [Ktedonobacteraceae bacterium]|nr:polysaccharide biosynthesis tyrosine autokinase [Ktedonobacteraceae bacterium]
MHSSLSRYILLAKRWMWMILLGMVICGSITYVITKLMHPVYQASALLVLTVTTSPSTYDNTSAVLEVLPTYAQLLNTPQVLNPVAKKYGLTIKQLQPMITVKPQSNTENIELDVQSSSPRLAAQLANEISQSFAQFSSTQLGVVQVHVLDAVTPTDAVQPKPSLDAAIGAGVGLGLALALIILFEWTDDHLIGLEEIQERFELDIVTIIPELSRRHLKDTEEAPALAEASRILSAKVNAAQAAHPFKLVMVTSAVAGEGKSTVAANLASFLAITGRRVLLVDANLRYPTLDQHFQLNNHQGLTDALLEMWTHIEVDLEGQATEIPSLRVLTAGVVLSNPSELLQSQLAKKLFEHFRNSKQFDYVIFDTSPVLPIADTQIIASYVDTTILVIDASKTPRKIIARTKEVLNKTGTTLLGVVINKSYWSEYGDIREYLNSIQRYRSKAIPTMTTPLHSASAKGTFTTFAQNANSRQQEFASK